MPSRVSSPRTVRSLVRWGTPSVGKKVCSPISLATSCNHCSTTQWHTSARSNPVYIPKNRAYHPICSIFYLFVIHTFTLYTLHFTPYTSTILKISSLLYLASFHRENSERTPREDQLIKNGKIARFLRFCSFVPFSSPSGKRPRRNQG